MCTLYTLRRTGPPSMTINIQTQVHCYEVLRQRIMLEFPHLDDETIRDSLEGITDLPNAIGEVLRSALVDEALSGGLQSRIRDMKERLSRLEVRAEKKRQLALEA